MKENLGYLLWAYLLLGGLLTVYSVSLVTRSRRVARELERLAAELRGPAPPTER